jgi:hypothetical protein
VKQTGHAASAQVSTPAKVGVPVHDTATLTGATASAGGTVTYSIFTDTQCTAGLIDAGAVNVTNGVVPNSNPITFSNAGTWHWQAVDSGDANKRRRQEQLQRRDARSRPDPDADSVADADADSVADPDPHGHGVADSQFLWFAGGPGRHEPTERDAGCHQHLEQQLRWKWISAIRTPHLSRLRQRGLDHRRQAATNRSPLKPLLVRAEARCGKRLPGAKTQRFERAVSSVLVDATAVRPVRRFGR